MHNVLLRVICTIESFTAEPTCTINPKSPMEFPGLRNVFR